MPIFPDENTKLTFKNNLVNYFSLKKNEKIVSLLKTSRLEFEFYTRETSWDGDFDIYNLLIYLSLESFVQIDNQEYEIAEEIKLIAVKLISGNNSIGDVYIRIDEKNSEHFIDQELLEKVEKIRILLTSKATGQSLQYTQEQEYKDCRKVLLHNTDLSSLTPTYIKSSSDLNEFWAFIQPKFKHYQERRTYIKETMEPLLNAILTPTKNPIQTHALLTLDKLNSDSVRNLWFKSMNRLINDPEGAITAAKTLLENVIKNILNELGIDYSDEKDDLPKLYSHVTEALQLAPAQHIENIFKQILGGCHSIVIGLAGLRNKISDAHTNGKRPIKPAKRHAELAVNLAGTMSMFLIASWENKKNNTKVAQTSEI